MLPKGLISKLTWVQISSWRHSFLSKVFTIFSFASVGIAYLGKPLEQYGSYFWRLEAWLIGSLMFLIGYAISGLLMPIEFQGESGGLVEIVSKMAQIQSYDFYKSRKDLAQKMVARFRKSKTLAQLQGPLDYVDRSLQFADTAQNWSQNSAQLYHSDVALRQYDRPLARLASALFIMFGGALLVSPTLTNFWHAILVLAGAI
jgi:hypothetical protein